MTLRTLFVLSLAFVFACAPEATSPVDDGGAPGDIRAVHIAQNGRVLDTLLRTGALGTLSLTLLVEGTDGTLRPIADERAMWGSTHPAVMDLETFRTGTEVFFFRRREGRARIIASYGGFRDTVTIDVQQVPARVLFDTDTIVTLAPNAIDVTGAPTAYHTFLFGAERADSNSYTMASTASITYEPVGDAPFETFSNARGDTVGIAGTRHSDGWMVVQLAGTSDTVPVQVANRYRVVRLSVGANGQPRPLPATITIPAGAAIVFRNETSFVVMIGGPPSSDWQWRIGPIFRGGTQAQRFDVPGEYPFFLGRDRTIIVVTPNAPSSP